MNYIKHLSGFFTLIRKDARLNASHISLYMALFQYWNFNRFQNPFPIYRENMMKQSKIGSKNTYHKCIKELHEARYICYHPSSSKFLPVRISVIPLDQPESQPSRFRQLDLFTETSVPKVGHTGTDFGTGEMASSCTDFETDNVSLLGHISTDFGTGTVPILGHIIKHKQIETESKQPTQKIFDKKAERSEVQQVGKKNKTGSVPRVSKSVHANNQTEMENKPPALPQVEEFFQQNNYPQSEAKKFFNHYKAIGWKIKGITPITDWNAAAHKWMLNSGKYDTQGANNSKPTEHHNLQYLYECFLESKQVFKHIMPQHFYQLHLAISKQTLNDARLKRISQVAGTNQHSLNQLWSAYLSEKEDDVLVLKDKPTLIAVAQKLEVLNHFQHLKKNGISTLTL